MTLYEQLSEATKSLFNIRFELSALREAHAELKRSQDELDTDLKRMGREMFAISERIARLETSRDADRAEMRAQTAQFGAEVERAALRLERIQAQVATQLPPAP